MFWTLLKQEVKSLPRGRFGLLALGLWLTLLTLLTALVLGSEGPALYSILVVTYVIPSLAMLPITAGYVYSDRSTRFVQSVFTSPVRASSYYLAKLAPPLVVAATYFVATAPFLAVFAYHVGVPTLVWRFLRLSILLVLVFVAVGGLIGILFVGRSSAAALGAAVAYAVFAGASVFLILIALALPEGAGRELFLRVLHLSPLTLGFDALDLYGFVRTDSAPLSLLALLCLGAGALAAALWIYTKQQAPETWELRRGGRILVPLTLLLVLGMPAVIATPDYAPAPPNVTASQGSQNLTLLFVPPGSTLQSLPHGFSHPFPMGEPINADLLVLFRTDPPLPLHNVKILGTGPNATFSTDLIPRLDAFEAHPTDDGTARTVLRVPATITFRSPESLGRTALIVSFELHWTDTNGTHVESGDQLVWVHQPDASWQLALAGLPGIALCVGSYAVRRRRLR